MSAMVKQTDQLTEFVNRSVVEVNKKLEELLPAADVEPTRLHEAVRHSVFAGGKRFRPALVFAVGDVFEVEMKTLAPIAAAIEMIHTYSLIHDDLPAMDDDDLRRGRPTCHKQFGDATAILAGDVLQSLAFGAIANAAGINSETKVKLISVLAGAAASPLGMVAGQQLDLDGEGRSISLQELEQIHTRKTGAMIVGSVLAGAIVGGAATKEVEAVTAYGASLGLLFQITDDMLDVTQSTSVLGKTAGKDANVEKATYPAFFGIETTGEMAKEVHQAACVAANSLPKPGLLEEIADYVLTRET